MITQKLIDEVISKWNSNCNNIMDSQKKYNEEALKVSIPRMEKLKTML